jgi:GLPGLI family protein
MLRFLFLSLALNLSHTSFSQHGKVTGKVTYFATVKKSLYISGAVDQTDTTWLYFNDSASSYLIDTKSIPDSKKIRALIEDRGVSHEKENEIIAFITNDINKNRFQYDYHKNGTPTMSKPWPIGDKEYCRVDTLADFNWELQPDTMHILGFLCQKAVSKSVWEGGLLRSFTAWYTPDIPVTYGPKNIFGLPGLVLLADSKYYTYKAIAVKLPLQPDEYVRLTPCENRPLIGKQAAEEATRRMRVNLNNMQKLRSAGN